MSHHTNHFPAMPTTRTQLISALLSVLIVGCATAPPPIAPAVAAGIKRFTAISVSADQFRRLYVGFTVFGNEHDERSIADWTLDTDYEAQLGQAAQKVFSANYVKVAYPRVDFAHANDLDGPWEAPAFWGPNWTAIEPYVKNICSGESLDAVLVVARRKSADIFGGTNQMVAGTGIYARRGISLLHYLAVVSLYDCKTAKSIATRYVARASVQSNGSQQMSLPVLGIPEETARQPTSQWSPEIENQLRSALRELPRTSWEDTLRTMVPAK